MTEIASVALPPDYDLTAIAAAAGAAAGDCLYEAGALSVTGITQAALEAAVAAYDHAAAAQAMQWVVVRAQRDRLLTVTQWLVDRHRDQIEAVTATTLTAADMTALLAWRQALRDLPAIYATGNPADVVFPPCPVTGAA